MKLNEGRAAGLNLISGYDPEGILVGTAVGSTVGTDRHTLPVLVGRDFVDTAIEAKARAELTPADIQRIVARRPAIVLAGSAAGPWHAPAQLRRAFEDERIAFETMDLGAACRTFNVLVQEDREVVALLLP
ncbi:MAG: MTH938/NDUFAF3 family protein [Steroidobacteraceae bacterium]